MTLPLPILQRLARALGRVESRVLVGLAAVAAAVYGFLKLAGEVAEMEMLAFDRQVLLAFRTPGDPDNPIGSRAVEEAVRDVTALGGVTLLTLITVLVAAALLFYRRTRQAVVLGVTIGLAVVSSEVLKGLYDRPRPDLVPHATYVYSHSFPSGHSTLAAATFLTLAAILSTLDRHLGFRIFVFSIAVLMIVAVGISRIYLGVHWPSDVIGGWALGAAWALAARLALAATAKTPPP